MQHKRQPLRGRQSIQHHQQRQPHRLRQQRLLLGIHRRSALRHRLRSLRLHRLFAPRRPRPQHVQTNVRQHRRRPAAKVLHSARVRLVQPQPCLLQRFVRLAQRTKHAVRHSAQVRPIPLVEQTTGREVGWINRYLDREYVRRLANTTLRIAAYNLLHFVRWWESVHHTDDIAETDLTESTLLDYVRFQSSQQPRPSSSTINDRVTIADRALRNAFPDAHLSDRSWVSSGFLAA